MGWFCATWLRDRGKSLQVESGMTWCLVLSKKGWEMGPCAGENAFLEEKQEGKLWSGGVWAVRTAMEPFYLWAQFSPFGYENILMTFTVGGGRAPTSAPLQSIPDSRETLLCWISCQMPVFLSACILELIRPFLLRMQMGQHHWNTSAPFIWRKLHFQLERTKTSVASIPRDGAGSESSHLLTWISFCCEPWRGRLQIPWVDGRGTSLHAQWCLSLACPLGPVSGRSALTLGRISN